ncbi:MAG TPA: hypothetical protein VKA21_00105 [Candidatus Binatia bacterium]|nr:hypothetical protein [Candidatus Binatia bacterium]
MARSARLVAALGCTLAVACCRERSGPRKTHLVRLPEVVASVAMSDDAAKYAYVEKVDDGGRVVHDGIADAPFPACAGLTFSPLTRKLFYWAGAPEGPGYLVADGTKIGDFGRNGTVVFSRDGTRWATAAGLREEVDGTERRPGPVSVVADGVELGRYPDASVPAFSPDGRHLAYLVASADAKIKLIVDGAERTEWPVPASECAARRKPEPRGPNMWPQFRVRYLTDGSLVVMTQDADGWGVYRDGVRIASYAVSLFGTQERLPSSCPRTATAVASSYFVSAENAPVVAWWERLAGEEERWRVVVDGKPVDDVVCLRPWSIHPPELTADGRRVAYTCAVREPTDGLLMVAGERRWGPYLDMWAHVWSDDGEHVAYGAVEAPSDRPWRYYVDGVARTEGFAEVWRPRLEAGTGRLAWQSKTTEDEAGGVLGIDGHRITSFDQMVWGPAFLRPGTATWVVRRGRRLTRLDVPTG